MHVLEVLSVHKGNFGRNGVHTKSANVVHEVFNQVLMKTGSLLGFIGS